MKPSGKSAQRLSRLLVYSSSILGLLVLALLPGNKYAWMEEFDPDVSAQSMEGGAGNSAVIAGALLLFFVAVQAFFLITAEKKWKKIVSGMLILLALLTWLVKFWPGR
jgi:hypothetical protein